MTSDAGVPRVSARARLAVLLVAAAMGALAVTRLPVANWAIELVGWIRGAGAAGVLVFAAVYVVATVGMLPGSVLTLGAGFAYGPLAGTAIVSPVSVLAATCAFLLGRTVARDWIVGRVAGAPRFAAIDRAVGRQGFKIVLLLRLSPLFPFNLLNYALGLTPVRLRDYVIASWIGMLPATFLYVYLGSLLTSATELAAGSPAPDATVTRVFYWGGLLATIVVGWVVAKAARSALDRSLSGAEDNGALNDASTLDG